MTSPAARVVDTAAQTAGQLFPDNLPLSAGLAYLGQTIESFQVACQHAVTMTVPGAADCSTDLRDHVVSAAQQVATAVTTTSPLLTDGDAISDLARTIGATTTVSAVNAGIDTLQEQITALQGQLTEVAQHGWQIGFTPGRRVALQGKPASYGLRLTNTGSLTTTYALTVTTPSPSVTLSPLTATMVVAPGSTITAPVTATTSLLGSAELQAEVGAVDAPDLATLRAPASLTSVDALLRVTSVRATPSFVEYGSGGASPQVVAQVANVADEPISGTARVQLLDTSGSEVYSTTAPVEIVDTLAPIDYPLGPITTTGLMTGTYTLAVDILDGAGQIIPKASGKGVLGVGQAVTAGGSVTPSLAPPGDVTATTSLTAALNLNAPIFQPSANSGARADARVAPSLTHAATVRRPVVAAQPSAPRHLPVGVTAVVRPPTRSSRSAAGYPGSHTRRTPSANSGAHVGIRFRPVGSASSTASRPTKPGRVSQARHSASAVSTRLHRTQARTSTADSRLVISVSTIVASSGAILFHDFESAANLHLNATVMQARSRIAHRAATSTAARTPRTWPHSTITSESAPAAVPTPAAVSPASHLAMAPRPDALDTASTAEASAIAASTIIRSVVSRTVVQAPSIRQSRANSSSRYTRPNLYTSYRQVLSSPGRWVHMGSETLHVLPSDAQETDVCGTITTDTHWTLSGSPYKLTCLLQVSTGVTLTIDPGVVVQGNGRTGFDVQGTLLASGSADQPIGFESADALPSPGDWGGIRFAPGATGSLSYTNVSDAGGNVCWADGYGCGDPGNNDAAVSLFGVADVTLDHVAVEGSARNAVGLSDANALGSLHLSQNTFAGNTGPDGVMLEGGALSRAATVPADGVGVLALGEQFIVVNTGALTLTAGTRVVGYGRTGLDVRGLLVATGTATAPVIFMSAAITPTAGDWGGIRFAPNASGSLSYARVEDAGGDICWADGYGCGDPGNNDAALSIFGISAVSLDHVAVAGSARNAVGLSDANELGSLHLSQNTFAGNAGAGGVLLEGGALSRAATVPADGVGTLALGEQLIVAPTGALTLTAGTHVEGYGGTGLDVRGALVAAGTVTDPVTFTSATTQPALGSWAGIRFAPGATGNLSYAHVDDAGGKICWADGYGCGDPGNNIAAVSLFGASVVAFDHLRVEDSVRDGVGTQAGAAPIVRDSSFVRNANVAIELDTANELNGLVTNSFSGNGVDGVQLDGGTLTGSVSVGPSDVGQLKLANTVTVGSSAALTLTAGATVLGNGGLDVQGTLTAIGTSVQPVSFTSGSATPSPGDWPGITFEAGALGYLNYAQITDAATGITAHNAAVTIHNSLLTADAMGITNCAGCTVVHAENNYWGTPDGPAPNGHGPGISSDVIATPYDSSSDFASTAFTPSYAFSTALDPQAQTTGVGGTATYHFSVRNTGNVPNTVAITPTGLDPSWYTLTPASLALIPGQVGQVTLTAQAPATSCDAAGTHPFTLTAGSAGDGATRDVTGTLTLTPNPGISMLAPDDNTTIGSTDVLFSWQTLVSGTATLRLWPSADPGAVRTYTATAGLQHEVTVMGLARNTDYTWSAHADSACGSADSAPRALHVGNGLVFAQRAYSFTIERDYNQLATIAVTNQDDVSHTLLLTSTAPAAGDLIVGFIGLGSSDGSITLQPGETRNVTLGLAAQDAQSRDYYLVAHLIADADTANPIQDAVPVHVHIHVPDIRFSLQEVVSDTVALTHTFRIINYGDPLTDLAVTVASTGTGTLYFVPGISHGHLDSGQSVNFDAYTSVGSDFRALTATVLASAAGVTQTLPVNESLPPGDSMYLGDAPNVSMEVHNDDWYCTNRPIINDVLNLPSGFRQADMSSGELRLGLYPTNVTGEPVRPHNLDAFVNGNRVGGFTNSIPNGIQRYPVAPTDLNESAYGPSQNIVRLQTTHLNGGHYVVATDLSLSVCMSHYREWVAAGSQDQANSIVASRGFLIPPAKTLSVQILSPHAGQHILAGHPVQVTARVSDDIGRAWSYIVIAQASNDGGALLLYDDGQHGDGEARDGVYGGTWIPSASASGPISLTVRTSTCTLSGSDAVSLTVDNPTYTIGVDHSVPLTGVRVLSDTLAPVPQSVTADDSATHLGWQGTLDQSTPMTTETFAALLPHMQPGEARQVAAGTTISYTGQSGTGHLNLAPLYVAAAHLIALSPPTQTVSVGGEALYTATLSNPTQSPVVMTPTVAGLPDGWTASLAPVTLPPGARLDVPLTVTVPASADASTLGDHPFAVLVQTDGGGQDAAGATLTVGDGLGVGLTPAVALASNGDVVTYTATISNPTTVDRDYALSIAGLRSDAVAFPSSVSVAVGQAVSVPVTVTAYGDVGAVRGFGLLVRARQDVAAQMIVYRSGRNPYTTLGNGQLSTRWYLAEGYTNLTFHQTLYLLNPGRYPARVRVHLLPANGRREHIVTVTVPGQRTVSLDVNRLYPKQALATIVTSDNPICAERVLTFGHGGFGATGNGGTALAASTWLFAEGATMGGRQTFLTILNPGHRRATVSALLHDDHGAIVGVRTIVVDGGHCGTMRLNDTVHAAALASTVSSDVPVVVERPYYTNNPNEGRPAATLVYGRGGLGTRWTFPAGDTTRGAHDVLLVFNSNHVSLRLRAAYYLSTGHVVTTSFTVPANARYTIRVNSVAPALANALYGVQLASLDGRGFVAEQTVYDARYATMYGTPGLAQ